MRKPDFRHLLTVERFCVIMSLSQSRMTKYSVRQNKFERIDKNNEHSE